MARFGSLFAVAAAGVLMIPVAPVSAQSFCGSRNEMVRSLADQFRENPTAVGVINGNAVLEVFVSEDGSWTILATGTDGRSCVLSAGQGWETNVLAMGEGT